MNNSKKISLLVISKMKSDANSVNAGMKCAKDDCRFVDLKARVGDSDEDEEDEDEDEDEEDEGTSAWVQA